MLEHAHHRVPVTALAFDAWNNVILAGEGSLLKIYNAASRHLLASLAVFQDQCIHGIALASDGSSAVIWGGSAFMRLSLSSTENGVLLHSSSNVAQAPDWILDAAFGLQPLGEITYELAIITAHNTLLFSLADEVGLNHSSSDSINIASNCILYSAHVRWLCPARLLIASGTAFGDVLVWSCFVHEDDTGFRSRKPELHYTFSAHEGSVFGVQISGKLQLPQGSVNSYLLATCSDDRSIKVWDISKFRDQAPAQTEQQRDTGFGDKFRLGDNTPECLAKTLGHVSRIWHVRFLDHTVTINGALDSRGAHSPSVSIMSFGEDATCIAWSMSVSPDRSTPFTLTQRSVDIAHVGKHIWSVATDTTGQVLTGGADGTIAIYTRNPLGTSASEIRTDGTSDQNDLRAYAHIGKSLVATTNRGRILMISSGNCDREDVIQEISPELPCLEGYSIVTSVNNTAVIAGKDGTIFLYQQNAGLLLHHSRATGKVAGLFACQAESGAVYLLATSVTSSTATMYSWHEQSSVTSAVNHFFEHERQVELPRGFVVTSFCVAQGKNHGLTAVFGSREGTLAVLDWRKSVDELSEPFVLLVERIHGVEAVTALYCQTVLQQEIPIINLFSTGRDGTQAVHELRYTDRCISLELIHQLSLPFGPNIEGLTKIDKTLLVWGFKGKQFVVYDMSCERQIMAVNCGGSHRQWAFQPHIQGGSFVWTKATKVYHIAQTGLAYNLLGNGGHGREIKALAVSPGGTQIIATGSEDTTIKLSMLADTHFQCLRTLKRHITGVQALRWSDDGAYLFSSGGYEEFFVWRIHEDCSAFELGVVCESPHPDNGLSDLRIMDFDIRSVDTVYTITMAYSNSVLKQWQYCRSAGWTLLRSADYLTACLTYVQHLKGSDTLLSAATDGHLTLWSSSSSGLLSWRHQRKIHQSSILSVAMYRLSNQATLVVSGGDDNAIGLTILAQSDDNQTSTQHTVAGTLLIPRAHAAAVTGVVLRVVTSTRLCLTSGSIDQRVKTWQIDITPGIAGVESLAIAKVQDMGTDVADVSSIAAVGEQVLVVGVGMDLQ
nr:putative wd repeat-containing protein [Quercus suber]